MDGCIYLHFQLVFLSQPPLKIPAALWKSNHFISGSASGNTKQDTSCLLAQECWLVSVSLGSLYHHGEKDERGHLSTMRAGGQR